MNPTLETHDPSIAYQDLMLPTPGSLFSAAGWIFELKYDGMRCLATKRSGIVSLRSKSGRDLSSLFPELVRDMERTPHDFIVDGELVILNDQEQPDWEALQARQSLRHTPRIAEAAREEPATLFAFDVLLLDGQDLRRQSLLARKSALQGLIAPNGRVRAVGHLANSSTTLWRLAVQLDFEGIVAKEAASAYTPGRSKAWQSINTEIGIARKEKRRATFR
jgi:bifunctional non-homologous end joining protein LigD